jgi:phosphoenolpyruvate synthase/pyruvate phosphate dikinase
VTYRLRNGFDHWKVHMAVVVQQMVFPQAAGILFTADPVTGNRKIASVEASFGLGEALVSGLVNADVYKVRDGEVVAKVVGTKQLAIHASPGGGTQEQAIEPERQQQPALTDAQVVRLAQLGGSKRTSAAPRTSNGACWTMTSRSSRAGRSPRCSPSPRPATERITSTSPSVISR